MVKHAMPASTTPARPERQQIEGDLPIALALVAFLLSAYLLTYSGVPHNPDEWFYLAGTHSALTGDWRGLQSHGWLFSLLAAPFYAAAMLIPGLGSFQAAALLNSVITALTAGVLFLVLQELELPRGLRTAAALIFGLGTLAWPTAAISSENRRPVCSCCWLYGARCIFRDGGDRAR